MRKKHNLNTAARLIGALALAIVGFISSYFSIPENFMYGPSVWRLPVVGAVSFFVTGWSTLGINPGFGGWESFFAGLRYTLVCVVVACFVFAMLYMFNEIWEFQYRDPFRWAQDLMRNWFEFIIVVATNKIGLITLVVGGAAAGRLAGAANWRWR